MENPNSSEPLFVTLLWVNSIGVRCAKTVPYDQYKKNDCEVGFSSS